MSGAEGAEAPGPLAEAEVSSLNELFSRTPPLSDADVGRIVAELRRARAKWIVEDSAPKGRKAPSKSVKLDVSLDDLGL